MSISSLHVHRRRAIFTLEYLLRWWDDAADHYGWHYPNSSLGLVDLFSILPFWLGFFVPMSWLHILRIFRVFRLLKFFRYSRSLQLVALAFYRCGPHLKSLGFSLLVVGIFCMTAMYEAEQDAQPDKFDSLFAAAWYTAVTVTTVGYGDISPVTPLGKIVAMLTFVFALTIFAGILGIVGNSFVRVLEEEADRTIDPIDVYRKERERRLLLKKVEKSFGPKYKE